MWPQAIVSEAERVKGARGKVSQRPDHKARDAVTRAGRMVNTPKTAGHVPGHKPGARSATLNPEPKNRETLNPKSSPALALGSSDAAGVDDASFVSCHMS